MNVCDLCKVCIMQLHPELQFWVKCSICGYCKINERLKGQDIISAKERPYARKATEEAILVVQELRKRLYKQT